LSASNDGDPATPPTGAEDGPGGALCVDLRDIVRPQSRRMIAHHAREFLDARGLLPCEVIFSPLLLGEVRLSPLFEPAMAAAARAQAAVGGPTAEERRRDLGTLVDFLGDQLDAAASHLPALPLDAGGFAILTDNFGPTPDDREWVLLGLMVSRILALHADRPAKVKALLDLTVGQNTDHGVGFLDPFLADGLADRAILEEMLGLPPTPMDLLADLALLYRGSQSQPSGRSEAALRLFLLFSQHALPACRDSLTEHLHGVLASSQPLSEEESAGEDITEADLLVALQTIADLTNQLTIDGAVMGGRRTAQLLDARILELIGGAVLPRVLDSKPLIDRLRTLFKVQRLSVGRTSRKILGQQIVDVIGDRDFPGRLRDEVEGEDLQLRVLGEIAALVDEAALGEATRRRLIETLDEVQYGLIRSSGLLGDLRRERLRGMATFMRVLDLAADGGFVPGRCLDEARDLLIRHARQPEFLRSCLAHLQGVGGTAGMIGELARRLRDAGIPFRDVTRAKVLVVEDEESAAAYVRMVLGDMGIEDVTLAANGRDALQRIVGWEHEIDLIICDWMMPVMSGLDFLKQIRAVAPTVPFLMVTALATVETVRTAMAHDVTAYIAKPFPPEQLEEKVLVLFNRGGESDLPAPPPL
ncbi:response regulator, partial [Rhodospirillum rubrum]|uniref:response regulator n=1 Tax=Rhodospirillum rubrum TaxID=1085 RepID=UPI0028A82E51